MVLKLSYRNDTLNILPFLTLRNI